MSIMEVIVSGVVLGQLGQNVLHFHNPDGGEDHDAVFLEIRDNWVGNIRICQNANFLYTTMSVQTIDGTPDMPTIYSLAGIVGSLTGEAAPPFISGLFSIRTAVPGRHGHGRFYMPGVHKDSITNGVIGTGALAVFQGVADDLTDRFKGGGTGPLALVVCPRSDPSSFHLCTSIVARQVFGVQRRRNIGHGS